MNAPTRKTALLAGTLFLLQLIPYYIGHELVLGSIVYQPDYLQAIQANRPAVATAVLLELLSAFAFVGFAILLYPLLRKVQAQLALAYLGIRFVEFGLLVLVQAYLMTLATLASRSANSPGILQAPADALLATWEWTALIYMVVFCLNALLFYYLLYRSPLLPKFISIWGFLGALLALAAPLLYLFAQSPPGMLLYAPIGLNELFLALWLIVRGFERNVEQHDQA